MKAVLLARQGATDGLAFAEIAKPIRRDNDVLARIRTATVTRGDVVLRRIPRVLWPAAAVQLAT